MKNTPTVNFNWLKEVLLNKDPSSDEITWANNGGGYRFLDKSVDLTGNAVAF